MELNHTHIDLSSLWNRNINVICDFWSYAWGLRVVPEQKNKFGEWGQSEIFLERFYIHIILIELDKLQKHP